MHGINDASQRLKLLSRAPIYCCPNLYFLPLSFAHTVLCHSLSSHLHVSLSLYNRPPRETLTILQSLILMPSPRIPEPFQPTRFFCCVHNTLFIKLFLIKTEFKTYQTELWPIVFVSLFLTCFKDKDCTLFVFAPRI